MGLPGFHFWPLFGSSIVDFGGPEPSKQVGCAAPQLFKSIYVPFDCLRPPKLKIFGTTTCSSSAILSNLEQLGGQGSVPGGWIFPGREFPHPGVGNPAPGEGNPAPGQKIPPSGPLDRSINSFWFRFV